MEEGFPLRITRRRNSSLVVFAEIVFAEINFLPCAPVAVGIVDITAAGVELDIARAAKFGASPAGKNSGVEDVALVGSLGFGTGSQDEDFSQVTGRRIDSAAGCFGESRHLGRGRFEQVGKIIQSGDGKNVAAISGAGQ